MLPSWHAAATLTSAPKPIFHGARKKKKRSMCKEQELDWRAAVQGKLPWPVYFSKWGRLAL
jgi:hypothetical protein